MGGAGDDAGDDADGGCVTCGGGLAELRAGLLSLLPPPDEDTEVGLVIDAGVGTSRRSSMRRFMAAALSFASANRTARGSTGGASGRGSTFIVQESVRKPTIPHALSKIQALPGAHLPPFCHYIFFSRFNHDPSSSTAQSYTRAFGPPTFRAMLDFLTAASSPFHKIPHSLAVAVFGLIMAHLLVFTLWALTFVRKFVLKSEDPQMSEFKQFLKSQVLGRDVAPPLSPPHLLARRKYPVVC
jgi:hypothetical protein